MANSARNSQEASMRCLIQQDPGLPRTNPTTSYWQSPPHKLSNVQSTSLPSRTDIAVLGSGITGASVAKAILANHATAQVAVFEARTICSGATGRNGGQLAINAAETYVKMREAVGIEMAGKIVRFNLKTLEAMREVAREFSGEDFPGAHDPEVMEVTKVRAFMDEELFQGVQEGVRELEADHPDLRRIYTVIDAETCQKDHGIHGAVGGVMHSAGSVWPYRLVTNLFDALLAQHASRLRIETNTPVTQVTYEPSPDAEHPYILHTPRGPVRATQVAYCTNGYTGHLLPGLRGALFPLKETMTVQELAPAIRRSIPTSWAIHYTPSVDEHTGAYADGLTYGMQSAKSGYYLFGGAKCTPGELISSDDTVVVDSSVGFLQESVTSLFGQRTQNSKLISAWSGVMCFSSDSLPLVGRLPAELTNRAGAGEWICGAYNGYGMASAWLAGESLALMMLGEPLRDHLPDVFLLSEARLTQGLSAERSMEFLSAD
ncbi:FAD dependent oxidoreductase [Aspergillus carlsbadensis]|nr:FAD dependent oxidoreductase [Aspergillus carlsbadensis]